LGDDEANRKKIRRVVTALKARKIERVASDNMILGKGWGNGWESRQPAEDKKVTGSWGGEG